MYQDQTEKNPIYFVNPTIHNKAIEQSTYEEGCLSLPGQFAEIARPDKCSLKYLDYHGQSKEDIAEEHLKNRELVKI